MASGLIPGTPVGQLFSRSSQPTTPTLQDIQENNLGGVSSGHAIPQLQPENSQKHKTKLCAEVPERPLPKDPFFQLLILLRLEPPYAGVQRTSDPKTPKMSQKGLLGQNRQSPIASDFGSRTQIAALFAVLLYPNV